MSRPWDGRRWEPRSSSSWWRKLCEQTKCRICLLFFHSLLSIAIAVIKYLTLTSELLNAHYVCQMTRIMGHLTCIMATYKMYQGLRAQYACHLTRIMGHLTRIMAKYKMYQGLRVRPFRLRTEPLRLRIRPFRPRPRSSKGRTTSSASRINCVRPFRLLARGLTEI